MAGASELDILLSLMEDENLGGDEKKIEENKVDSEISHVVDQNEISVHNSPNKKNSPKSMSSYKEIDLGEAWFNSDSTTNVKEPKSVINKKSEDDKISESLIHAGDTDSSEDEDNRYFENKRYNSYGADINKKLKEEYMTNKDKQLHVPTPIVATPHIRSNFVEPIFGFRVSNPMVNADFLKTMMHGRKAVTLSNLKAHTSHGDLKSNWVTGGVLIEKSQTRISAKSNEYVIWKFSDLKGNILTASLFLFGRCYKELWKTSIGSVFGILNPGVLENRAGSKDEAVLSIKTPDQLMIWGTSPDLGKCKAKKKDGQECGAVVNKYSCDYCAYHVRSEYKKFKGRSELQSPSGGSIINLRNKVLGKNEVFYGGKSFTASQPLKNNKVKQKDNVRLGGLGCLPMNEPVVKAKEESSYTARTKNLLKLLSENPVTSTDDTSKNFGKDLKLSQHKTNIAPSLSDPTRDNSLKKNAQPGNTLTIKDNKKSSLKSRFNSLQLLDTSSSKSFASPKNIPIKRKPSDFTDLIIADKDDYTKPNNNVTKICPSPANKLGILQQSVINKNHVKSPNIEENKKIDKTDVLSKVHLGKKETDIDQGLSITNKSHSSSPNNVENISSVAQKERNDPSAHHTSLSKSSSSPKLSQAKLRALALIKKKGPLERGYIEESKKVKRTEKRPHSPNSDELKNEDDKSVLSERFLRLMKEAAGDKNLLDYLDHKSMMEHFEKMEKKEQMEEKMLSIFKLDCKAVKCLKCHYTWFKASDECKASQHPIKVIDAVKRFFRCGNCDNRTVSLHILPLIPCNKCSGTNWLRAPMIKESVCSRTHSLSIRGGEQKFVNGVSSNDNIDLLVPDE